MSGARANGRSLIYEPGAAPPPVITVYLVRARAAARRPQPPRAQSRFRWRVVRPLARRVRSAPPLRPSRARAASENCAPQPPGACHAPPLSAARRTASASEMPRVKPACVRRVSIGTYLFTPTSRLPTSHHTLHRPMEQ